MNFERFVAGRISLQSRRTFSRLVVRLAVSAVALSIGVMLISIAVVLGFKAEIKNKIIGFAAPIQVTKFRFNESFEFDPVRLDTAMMRRLHQVEGVTHVQPFATKAGIAKAEKEIEGIVTKGVDTTYDWSFLKQNMVAGGALDSLGSERPSEGIVISRYLADRLLLEVGDELILYFVQQPPRARKLTIQGIYATDLEDVDRVYCLIDLRHVRKLNNWEENQIAGYEVFTQANDRSTIAATQERVFSQLEPNLNAQSVQQRFPQLFDWLSLLDVNVQIILTLMVLVAGINMVTALLIMILERTPMIGLLKSLGATNRSVRTIFVYNAAWLIGLGILVGNGLALALLGLQTSFGIITLPAESYYITTVPIHFSVPAWLAVNLGTLLVCTLVMIVPTAYISRIDPVRALRFD